MSGDHHLNHNNSPTSSAAAAAAADWQFGNQSMSMALPNYPGIQPQVSMADSFYPNHPYNSNPSNPPNPGFAVNVGRPAPLPPRLDMGMFLPPPTANPGILPPTIADFPADSSFVERAAKFSSFSAGNFSALVNPFAAAAAAESLDHGLRCESPAKIGNHRDNASGREETPDVANVSGDSSSRGLNAKKRKKSGQDMELDQAQDGPQFSAEVPKENAETKQNVECSSSTAAAGRSNGKSAKGGGSSADGAKQDYIHVRARRGQATNSHSLAERVRRERISERMKYLQDLVPGCSKVTGKAVMLDEIINYVQSLQRQVEFLSMKLATVNPSIDLNIEELLSKDILQPRVGPSPLGFSPDLIHPQLLPLQQGLVPTRISGMVNHAEALRRAVSAQFTAMNGLKEPTTQLMPNPWETELQNMVHMNFGTNPPHNYQELNGKPNDGFPL